MSISSLKRILENTMGRRHPIQGLPCECEKYSFHFECLCRREQREYFLITSSGEIGTLNYFPGVFICVCQNRSNRYAFLCLFLYRDQAGHVLSSPPHAIPFLRAFPSACPSPMSSSSF